jgi:hypothetical protein
MRRVYPIARDVLIGLVLAFLVVVAIHVATDPRPGPAGPRGAQGPQGAAAPAVATAGLGLCVSYAENDGVEYVSSVSSAVDIGGVTSCPSGALVPVAPPVEVGGSG